MVSDEAVKKLQKYDYPGNVRELENIIEQTVSMAEKEHVLTEKLLSMPETSKKAAIHDIDYDAELPLDEYLETIEEKIIKATMVESDGNITKAAKVLQIKRQTLQHKLKKYHIFDIK